MHLEAQRNMASYDSKFQRCITRENAEPLCCVPETNKIFQLKKRQIKPILYTLFQKTEENSMFSNSFCEASLTQIPKSDRHEKKEPQKNISFDRCENSQQNTGKFNSITYAH